MPLLFAVHCFLLLQSELTVFSSSRGFYEQAYWKMVFEDMGVEFNVEPFCIWRESRAYPSGEWLPGAELNAAANCLRAKPGRSSEDVAIVWRDEGKDSEPLNFMTLEELRKKVW